MDCTERRNEFRGEEEHRDKGRGGACEGIRMVKEGIGDIALGLKEIEKAKKNVNKAIREVEVALEELRRVQRELESAGCYEKEGLRDISSGIHLIEEELKKPILFPPICH